MSYDAAASATYSGRSAFYLYLYVRRDQVDTANNRSSYAWVLQAVNDGHRNQTYALDCFGWSVNIGGQIFNGCHGLDFRGGQRTITLGSGTTGWFSHDGNGDLTLWFSAGHYNASIFGTAQTPSTRFDTDRIAKVPSAPAWSSITNVGTDRMTVNWGAAAANGAGLDAYLVRYSVNENMAGYVDTLVPSTESSKEITGLTPGTAYYWLVYAHNAVGFGPATPKLKQSTIATVPPGITVSPAVSGAYVDLVLTPPGGSSGVTKYRVQRRAVGSTAASSFDTSSNTYRDPAVLPGSSYEWRASAFYGDYQSPWSSWVAATLPNPNLNPGSYWDGGSPNTENATYSWAGAPELSQSVLTGVSAEGWLSFPTSPLTNGVAHRTVGGLFGTYAARYAIFANNGELGLVSGVGFAGAGAVGAGETYWGSLHARVLWGIAPAVLQPGIAWYDASGSVLSYTWGEVRQRASNNANYAWERYTVSGVAPAGAVRGGPVIRDAGSPALPFYFSDGSSIILDGAMLSLRELVPYFSGSSAALPGYSFEWEGAADRSASIRRLVPDTNVQAILDPDCPAPPAPPVPPVVVDDCVDLDVYEWRRYALMVPGGEVHIWRAVLPTLVISTKGLEERQIRIRYFPNPDSLLPDQIDKDSWEAEQILSYLPANATITLDAVTQRARAQLVDGTQVAADNLLYGTGGVPPTWPELTCGSAYVIALDVPTDSPSGNLSAELFLTERM